VNRVPRWPDLLDEVERGDLVERVSRCPPLDEPMIREDQLDAQPEGRQLCYVGRRDIGHDHVDLDFAGAVDAHEVRGHLLEVRDHAGRQPAPDAGGSLPEANFSSAGVAAGLFGRPTIDVSASTADGAAKTRAPIATTHEVRSRMSVLPSKDA
jgi:hypothetical protein